MRTVYVTFWAGGTYTIGSHNLAGSVPVEMPEEEYYEYLDRQHAAVSLQKELAEKFQAAL